ncbi:MAG: mevalonate kinase family protein, partial [Myxococcaceae bacterium]
ASTESLITKVEDRFKGTDREDFVQKSDTLSAQLEEGLTKGDFPALTEAAEGLHRLLCTLGPLETEPMRRLLALASSYSATGKISGAGGGDGCILFSPDEDSRAQLLEGLKSRDFYVFPLTLEAGLRGESTPDPRLEAWVKADVRG